MTVTQTPIAELAETTAAEAVRPEQENPTGETRLRMRYEEFLRIADEDKHAEWTEERQSSLCRHQQLVGFLYTLLLNFVQHFRLGELLVAPYEMKVVPDGNSREPDILFVATENLARLTEKNSKVPPIWSSKSSRPKVSIVTAAINLMSTQLLVCVNIGWCKPAWLWGEERPSPLLLFAEIAGLPEAVIDLLRQSQQHQQ